MIEIRPHELVGTGWVGPDGQTLHVLVLLADDDAERLVFRFQHPGTPPFYAINTIPYVYDTIRTWDDADGSWITLGRYCLAAFGCIPDEVKGREDERWFQIGQWPLNASEETHEAIWFTRAGALHVGTHFGWRTTFIRPKVRPCT